MIGEDFNQDSLLTIGSFCDKLYDINLIGKNKMSYPSVLIGESVYVRTVLLVQEPIDGEGKAQFTYISTYASGDKIRIITTTRLFWFLNSHVLIGKFIDGLAKSHSFDCDRFVELLREEELNKGQQTSQANVQKKTITLEQRSKRRAD